MPLQLKPSAFHNYFLTCAIVIFSFSQKNFWKAFLETHEYCSYWIIFIFLLLGYSVDARDDFSLWKQSSLNLSYVCIFINPLWKQDWLLVAPGSPQPSKQISCSLGIWAGLSQIPHWNKQCRPDWAQVTAAPAAPPAAGAQQYWPKCLHCPAVSSFTWMCGVQVSIPSAQGCG